MTHRAILFGLLAEGTTEISGWLDAGDCRSSLEVARSLGAAVDIHGDGRVTMTGTAGQLLEPVDVLNCGNSGTTMRMFLGAIAARVPYACLTGDSSLRQRPMGRVIHPLTEMGAEIFARATKYAPLTVRGGALHGIQYRLPVASAQVKSAVLIAGLLSQSGETEVIEPERTRDHTENMLQGFGAEIQAADMSDGRRIRIASGQTLRGTQVSVPGDFSSAAFLLGAAAIIPGAQITVENVGLNPTRTGFLRALQAMGADVETAQVQQSAGELIGTVTIRQRPLRGIQIPPSEIPSLIDELPILAVVAAYAQGTTSVSGAAELRVKETDRIRAIVEGLQAVGANVQEREDGFTVSGQSELKGGVVNSHHDHRIAMSFAVAGMASKQGVSIVDWDCVGISYPTFLDTFKELGARM